MSEKKLIEFKFNNKREYCGSNFIINIIKALQDISYPEYDQIPLLKCQKGIKIDFTQSPKFNNKLLYNEDDPLDYINYNFEYYDKDYNNAVLVINNYRAHITIKEHDNRLSLDRKFIDFHFTLNHRVSRADNIHLYFEIFFNNISQNVILKLKDQTKIENSLRNAHPYLTHNDIKFMCHCLNLKEIISKSDVSLNLLTVPVNESNITTLLVDEQKRYIIYSDSYIFQKYFGESVEQLYELFIKILKYTNMKNPHNIKPHGTSSVSCYDTSFNLYRLSTDRILIDDLKNNYNCNALETKNSVFKKALKTKIIQLDDQIKDTKLLKAKFIEIDSIFIKLNLWNGISDASLTSLITEFDSIETRISFGHFKTIKNNKETQLNNFFNILRILPKSTPLSHITMPETCIKVIENLYNKNDSKFRNSVYSFLYNIMSGSINDSNNVILSIYSPTDFISEITRHKKFPVVDIPTHTVVTPTVVTRSGPLILDLWNAFYPSKVKSTNNKDANYLKRDTSRKIFFEKLKEIIDHPDFVATFKRRSDLLPIIRVILEKEKNDTTSEKITGFADYPTFVKSQISEDNLKDYTKNKYFAEDIIKRGGYYDKYMKYKLKYLKLKKSLNL
jgi:hypothetical protein